MLPTRNRLSKIGPLLVIENESIFSILYTGKRLPRTRYSVLDILMRRASEAGLFFLGFPRIKKPLHNGSYEHRVPRKKKNILYQDVCVCDSTS